jgi:16S rRNA (cytosine967-C5)-methyltransferase
VVRRVFEQGAYADRALQAEAAGLDSRDRQLAMALAYGTVQRKGTLDFVVAQLVSGSLARLEPGVLAALRLGLFQLLFLDAVADHAAVNESVELAKQASRGGASLVNAVLRRAAREGHALIDALDDATPEGAALLHSVPEWLAVKWFDELGPREARSLLTAVNEPPESAVRVNELVATRDQVLAELPAGTRPDPVLPEALVLGASFDAHGSHLFERGAIMPQSRGSMAVARALAPAQGERVLDLCAAPGGKTTHLAALMGDSGEVIAVERHPGRAQALRRTCERMRASCVSVVNADATEPLRAEPFDRVLVDPPCSGLGTLQSRPDIRWRASPDAIAELATIQGRILAAAATATRPGGTLVYSVCTISHPEGPGVVEAFLDAYREFEADGPFAQLLPHIDATDGFFMARLRRRPPIT